MRLIRFVASLGLTLAFAWAAIAQEGTEPKPASSSSMRSVPQTHSVQSGDTLWGISERYYGDAYEWPKLWSYNPEITNPHWIYPGATVYLIPSEEGSAGGVGSTPEGATPGLVRRTMASGGIYLRDKGYLDAEALANDGYIIAAREEQMMMSNSDVVYLRFRKGADKKVGAHYTIYRKINDFERNEEEKGELVRIMGTVRLEDYDEKLDLGHAQIVETLEPIERGYRVAPMMRRFNNVTPRVAQKSLTTEVIASLYDFHINSEQQVVFVDVGEEDGVEVGNRFRVMRQGDEWRVSVKGRVGRGIQTTVDLPDEPEQFPDEVVAEGVIVSTRPSTSALFLTSSIRAVQMGDRAEMVEGY